MEIPIDMQHQVMGYDRTATMFSPEGHLLQVEYAEKTVRLGPSSLGMVCSDGVFIIADKRIRDVLINSKSLNRIFEIDDHIIASTAGIVSDARVLVERGQLVAQQHKVTYDTPIEVELVMKEIANIKQQFSQYGGARPFGVSIMIAGIQNQTPEIYTSDVTGNYLRYNANAIGENDEKIKELLRKEYKKNITLKKGVQLALKIYKEIQGSKFDIDKFELCYIDLKNKKITRLEGKKIESFVSK